MKIILRIWGALNILFFVGVFGLVFLGYFVPISSEVFLESIFIILIWAAFNFVLAFVYWWTYALFGFEITADYLPGWMLYFLPQWGPPPRIVVGIIMTIVSYAGAAFIWDVPGESFILKTVPNFFGELIGSEAQ